MELPLVGIDGLVVAFEDNYPSAPGHTLIIPRRHVGRVVDLTVPEALQLWTVALRQINRLGPRAFTIGINDGEAAGQTVEHVHLHVIPRTSGDVPDPRGGIRWVLPATADYWSVTA